MSNVSFHVTSEPAPEDFAFMVAPLLAQEDREYIAQVSFDIVNHQIVLQIQGMDDPVEQVYLIKVSDLASSWIEAVRMNDRLLSEQSQSKEE